MRKRLIIVHRLLALEGFHVEIEKEGSNYLIRESSCPYFHIGQTHPEVCSVDQTLISILLNIPAQKIQCLLHGDSACTYVIPSNLIPESELSTFGL